MKTTVKISIIFKLISLILIMIVFTSCQKDDYCYIDNEDDLVVISDQVDVSDYNEEVEEEEVEEEEVEEEEDCYNYVTESFIIDFEEFAEGEIISKSKSVKIKANTPKDYTSNRAMIFDSDAKKSCGGDDDLLVKSGNILIISEDLYSICPDDNAKGGFYKMLFGGNSNVQYFTLIDNEKKGGYYVVFTNSGKPSKIDLPTMKDGESIVIAVNSSDVTRMDIHLVGSGAIDNIIGSRTKKEKCNKS